MKKILNLLRNIIITIYVVMVIFITVCLLSFNDYKVATFSGTTILPIIDEDLGDLANVGDLLIIEKDPINKFKEGDTVFFYYTEFGTTTINYAKVTEVMPSGEYGSLKVEGDYVISYTSELIGKKDSTTTIPNLGKAIHYLESKWGFLFLGVFPSIIVFLYTAYSVFMEVTVGDDDEDEDENIKKKKNTKKVKSKKTDNEIDKKIKERDEEEQEEKKEKIENETEENDEIKENKTENIASEIEEVKEEKKSDVNGEKKQEDIQEEKQEEKKEDVKTEVKIEETKEQEIKKEEIENKIEEKKKTLTDAQKRALIEAKLKSMTPEEKRALIEAKKRKLEEEKRKNNN